MVLPPVGRRTHAGPACRGWGDVAAGGFDQPTLNPARGPTPPAWTSHSSAVRRIFTYSGCRALPRSTLTDTLANNPIRNQLPTGAKERVTLGKAVQTGSRDFVLNAHLLLVEPAASNDV